MTFFNDISFLNSKEMSINNVQRIVYKQYPKGLFINNIKNIYKQYPIK